VFARPRGAVVGFGEDHGAPLAAIARLTQMLAQRPAIDQAPQPKKQNGKAFRR
jgi:hypothetical protein